MAQNAAVFLISFVRYRKGLQRLRRTCQRRRRSWLRTGFLGLIGLLAAAPTPAQWRSVVTFTLNDGPHIAFLDGNQHLRQIWCNTAYNTWFGQDLTTASNGTPAAAGSALASWIQSDGPHIAYLDTSGHVHQLWYTISTGVWNHQDLSATTNASTAEAGTPLNIFSGPDGDHIFYLDTNQHLDQIWWMNTQWIWQDLMADVSGVHLPSATSGLANFTLDGSIPQIVFIDQVGDLEQRWWQNNQFVQQDLTALLVTNFSISGQVTTLVSPLSGVNMILSGSASGVTTTDANGNYSFTVQYGGTYTVTPSMSGYNFNPASQTFNYLNSNQVANFSGTIPGGPGSDPNAAREFIRFNGQVVVVENGH